MKTLYLVLCTLASASHEINGVKFVDHPEGKISESPIEKHIADGFRGIDGYHVREVSEGSMQPENSGQSNIGALEEKVADLQAALTQANEQIAALTESNLLANESLKKSQSETAEANDRASQLQKVIDAEAAKTGTTNTVKKK